MNLQKINFFIPSLFLEILQRYCKIVTLGTLDMPCYTHQELRYTSNFFNCQRYNAWNAISFSLYHIFKVVVTPSGKLVSFVNVDNVILIVNDKKIENKLAWRKFWRLSSCKKIKFIPCLFLEVLLRYCKLIFGTLGMTDHTHQK